ncbi:hypothetical protein ACFOPN_19155 [Xanthomonas hyacinthi]|uniref:hypothetical protein n=1 Tax=Xanthomonas hyacinthi TaxID=56455 RepID=UPI000AA8CD9B
MSFAHPAMIRPAPESSVSGLQGPRRRPRGLRRRAPGPDRHTPLRPASSRIGDLRTGARPP